MKNSSRLTRERRTVNAMVRMYCAAKHRPGSGLCPDCSRIDVYAAARIEKCPFQDAKPVCLNSRAHCYAAAMREQIRAVMRYSGPRMIVHHPVLAVRHLLDGRAD